MAEPQPTQVVDAGPVELVLRHGRGVVRVGTEDVLVVRAGRRLFAMRNVCPHQGYPLDDGRVAGKTIACAMHGYRYDLRSGAAIPCWRRPAPAVDGLELVGVEQRDGHVLLTVPTAWTTGRDRTAASR